ncbi:MAG: hypothetical protein PWP30_1866 [Eubacteriaceae bacterium]|nr:hypothetical protein [Eubacteriaceae bacterium]
MSITFYGERGLVNSIILDMNSKLSKQKNFLKAIVFEDGQKRNWIDEVTEFHYIVEPSFAQFGDPDLIIIAEEKEKKNYFEEDEAYVSKKYHDRARALKNQNVVDLCKKHFGDNPEFLFIALTNDSATTGGRNKFSDFFDKSFLPAIGEDNWEIDKKQFGLVSCEMLEQYNVINRSKGYFALASEVFLGLPANTGSNTSDRTISTTNMKNWDQYSYDELEKYFNKPHADIKIEKLNGSYSIKGTDGRTLVKLYVENNQIQIAFRNDNVDNKLAEGKERVKVGSGSGCKSFIVVYPNIDHVTDEMENEIINFIKS